MVWSSAARNSASMAPMTMTRISDGVSGIKLSWLAVTRFYSRRAAEKSTARADCQLRARRMESASEGEAAGAGGRRPAVISSPP
jgi:hypothetical protein